MARRKWRGGTRGGARGGARGHGNAGEGRSHARHMRTLKALDGFASSDKLKIDEVMTLETPDGRSHQVDVYGFKIDHRLSKSGGNASSIFFLPPDEPRSALNRLPMGYTHLSRRRDAKWVVSWTIEFMGRRRVPVIAARASQSVAYI